ncbi:RHS repeat domain-containing protein [Flavobacterium sp. HNIBRBA15423]|uniref:RHS repeat domain-containing protein n=1 Tax=Flavobacterium sp. HNIBRBA15423 TaxID=3458683 RepID=UPI004043BF4A
MITKNSNDELGQLISKNVGGTDATGASGLQTVDYNYNIRGWLKNINDVNNIGTDLFSFKINYNDAETATDLYNGNISETFWKTNSDNKLRKYQFSYDNLNRLLDASYTRKNETTAPNAYRESLSYDKNGNIQRLNRYGVIDDPDYAIHIDNLIYEYDNVNKNQLLTVTDETESPQGFKDGVNEGNDYEYDANGNMKVDNNKGIRDIIYNHLNLPTEINFVSADKIEYLYNATGQKVSKVVTETGIKTQTDYLAGGFQYKVNELQFFPHAEGYVKKEANSYKYVFNYTDHLGNIRLSYTDIDSNGTIDIDEIIEENEYYPFGLKHESHISSNAYQMKYNGKELQTELGLNMYDYGARNYDPALGRWMNVDSLAEKYNNMSTYNYVNNTPINAIDPDGKKIVYVGETRKERRALRRKIRSSLKEQRKSSAFREIWSQLKNYEKEYRFREGTHAPGAAGQFVKTYGHTLDYQMEFDKNYNLLNPEYNENPDRAGGDIYIGSDTFENKELLPHVIVEEMVHAVQFDSAVSTEEARAFDYSNFSDSYAGNREFEAKMLVGIINFQSGIPLYTENPTMSAQQYGVEYLNNGSSKSDYFSRMLQWQESAKDSPYGRMNFDPKILPTILENTIK